MKAMLLAATLTLAACAPAPPEESPLNVWLVDWDHRDAADLSGLVRDHGHIYDHRSPGVPSRGPSDGGLPSIFGNPPCFMPAPGDQVPDCLRTDR